MLLYYEIYHDIFDEKSIALSTVEVEYDGASMASCEAN